MSKQQTRHGALVRMCAGCGARRNQSEMFRIVKTQSGTLTLDPQDGSEGRSAYLCHDKKCLERLRRSRRLGSLLRYGGDTQAIFTELEEHLD